MNSRAPQRTVIVLSEDDTRAWHAVFSRELRDHHRSQILARCETRARKAGAVEYVIYDAYESFIAKGLVTPAA